MSWFWIAERATGLTGLLLLSLATFLGTVVSAHWRSTRFPEVMAVSLHRNISLMSIVFVGFHALAAVLDDYVAVGANALIIPFVAEYRTFWVGMGTIAFDLFLAILITSWLRGRIPPKLWRALHGLTYLCWAVATVHVLGAAYERQLTFAVAVFGVILVVPATLLRFIRPGKPRAILTQEAAS